MHFDAIHSAAVHAASMIGAQDLTGTNASVSIEVKRNPIVELFRFLMFVQGLPRVEHVGFKVTEPDEGWAFYQYTTTNDHCYHVAVRFVLPIMISDAVWL